MLVPPIQVMNDHVGKPFKTGDLGIPRNFRNLWWNSSIFAKFLGRTGRLDGGGNDGRICQELPRWSLGPLLNLHMDFRQF